MELTLSQQETVEKYLSSPEFDTLVEDTFNFYDRDQSGAIDVGEIYAVIADVWQRESKGRLRLLSIFCSVR